VTGVQTCALPISFRAREARCARVPGDLDADPGQQEALGAVGSLGLLPGELVPGGVRGAGLRSQADELPRLDHRVSPRAALVPRPAPALLGHGAPASQRALDRKSVV